MFAVVYCPDFYIQCERVFRPQLNGQALVIASNDGNGGSRIVACSKEAQNLELLSTLKADQLNQALTEFITNKKVNVISPNYELYADLSARFLKSLSLLAPRVSAYANDEAFLDLEDLKLQEGLDAFAKNLRNKLKQWLGISVFVGIAPTKTLSKLASNAAQTFKESRGVVDISELDKRLELLALVPVSDITGVSKKVAGKLSEINIHTALELSKAQKSQVRRRSSVVIERIALELSGLRCEELEVNIHREKLSSFVGGQTEVHTYTQAQQALKAQLRRAELQLESLMCACEKVTIGLATTRFNQKDPPFKNALTADLAKPTNSISAIGQLATQLLESLWREGYQYYSLELSLEGLNLNISDQFGLFSNPPGPLRNSGELNLPKAINIETLIGPILGGGSASIWRDKRSLLSPSFTTKWGDILRVS